MNWRNPPKWLLYVGGLAMLIGVLNYAVPLLVPSMNAPQSSYEEVSLDQLETQLITPSPQRPKMKELQFVKHGRETFPGEIVLEWAEGGQRSWHAYVMTAGDFERIRTEAKDHNVGRVEKAIEEASSSGSSSSPVMMIVLMVAGGLGVTALGLWMMSRMGGKFGGDAQETVKKSVGQWVEPDQLTETFNDVAGIDEVTDDLQLLVEMLKDPQRLNAKFGATVPRGVIFTGGPGVGKTLCARVVAGEAKVPFFSIAGSSFEEVFVGLGAARARKMFEEAEKKGVCIIFIDEIDAVGRKRQSGPGGVGDATLNQLLVLMDGFFKTQAIVIAATNRDDILDDALLRRLPWKINFPLPDQNGRLKIMKVHSRSKPVKQQDLVNIAATTQGFSGDALRNMLNEGAISASQRTKHEQKRLLETGVEPTEAEERVPNVITDADLFEGLLRHLMGPARKNLSVNADELISTAIHELFGHAFCCAYQHSAGRTEDVVRFVTVQPRSRAGGLAFITPDRDLHFYSENYIHSQAVTAFGGSAAELELLSQKTSGVDNDFEKAYKSIHRAVSRWGMSDKVGIISIGQQGYTAATEIGDHLRDVIDEECKRIGNEMHEEARRIVRKCMQSEHAWEALEYLIVNRIMVQDCFDHFFAKVFHDVQEHPEWDRNSMEPELRERFSAKVKELATRLAARVEETPQDATLEAEIPPAVSTS